MSTVNETLLPAEKRRKRPDLAERNRSGHPHPIFPMGMDAEIKHCTACCKDKPLADFGRDSSVSDGKRAQCKRCTSNAVQRRYYLANGREKQRLRERERRARIYKVIEERKQVPCADCGGRFPVVCMDFDHVSGDKIESVSRMVHKNFGLRAILAEIDKCQVVCSNCHRIRTAARGQWYGSAEEEGAV